MNSHQISQKIAQLMLEKQAKDVAILDLRDITPIADFFVLATGDVDVHLRAIVDNVERGLRELDDPVKAIHKEGYTHLNWVLLDYGDIIVHLFNPETRKFYQLEKLWGDAPTEWVEDDLPFPQS